jgi:predicted neuraminidase
MPVALRTLLIIILWVLCGMGIRSLPTGAKPPFAKASPSSREKTASPVFLTDTINPDQGLPMVHVAALAQTPDGILHCVWYGGGGECRPDVNIYLAQREPGGRWTRPVAIMTRTRAERDLNRPVQALGNALLIAGEDGELRLLFVTIAMGKWSGSQLNSSISKDGGLTWSKAQHLTLSPFFNLSELVRNRAVTLRDGGWCIPIYQEFLGKFPELLWLSREGVWRKTRIAGGCSVFQPSLVPTGADSVVVLMRDYTEARKIHVSSSHDGGLSWSRAMPTTLSNPDAGISGLPLGDNRILLAYNDSPKDRSDLSLAISPDCGQTWSKIVSLRHEAGASFSYPYLFPTTDGMIHLAYTWKGRELRLITFNEAWLNDQAARSGTP